MNRTILSVSKQRTTNRCLLIDNMVHAVEDSNQPANLWFALTIHLYMETEGSIANSSQCAPVYRS